MSMFEWFDALRVDYFLRVLTVVTLIFVFVIQYILCVKAKNRTVAYLPLVYVAIALAAAYFSLTRQFLGMGRILCYILCDYAGFCLAAILLAWLLAWIVVLRKRPKMPQSGQNFWKDPVKRKHLIISIGAVLCLALAFVIKWEVGYRRPYKDLERSDLIGIDIVFGG